MSIIASAFALGFLVMGIFVLSLGGAALAGRLHAIGAALATIDPQRPKGGLSW